MLRQRLFRIALLALVIFSLVQPGPVTAQGCVADCPVYLPVVGVFHPVVPVRVVKTDGGRTRCGVHVVRGNIALMTDAPVYDVRLEVRWYEWNGQLFDVKEVFTRFPATLPGHLNYFMIWTGDPSANVGRTEVTVKSWSLASDITYAPLALVEKKVTGESNDPGPENLKVLAKLRNDNAQPVSNVQLMVWALGQTNESEMEEIAGPVLPGETIEYSTDLWRVYRMLETITDTVQVEAQGVVGP